MLPRFSWSEPGTAVPLHAPSAARCGCHARGTPRFPSSCRAGRPADLRLPAQLACHAPSRRQHSADTRQNAPRGPRRVVALEVADRYDDTGRTGHERRPHPGVTTMKTLFSRLLCITSVVGALVLVSGARSSGSEVFRLVTRSTSAQPGTRHQWTGPGVSKDGISFTLPRTARAWLQREDISVLSARLRDDEWVRH